MPQCSSLLCRPPFPGRPERQGNRDAAIERTSIKEGELETAASFPQHPPGSWRAAARGQGEW